MIGKEIDTGRMDGKSGKDQQKKSTFDVKKKSVSDVVDDDDEEEDETMVNDDDEDDQGQGSLSIRQPNALFNNRASDETRQEKTLD